MTTLTVGSGQQFTTIAAAVTAASTGDTIDILAGTYTNDFPGTINGLTLVGIGTVKLVATTQPPNGKAYLDVAGNTTLRNLDISGVTVPDANGAAIRYESGNLVLDGVTVHGNQDGILGASDPAGTITIQNSEFYGNGTTTGSTHNIYIGDIATFTLTNSYIHDANTGHEVKSRAENNVITNNRIEDNSGTASYEIDLPNGGNATISGNTIQKSANSGNRVSIAYGEEGSLHAGTTVSITNNTFVSDQAGATVLWDAGNARMTASGNVIYGYSTLDKAGIVGSGFTTLTTRPSTTSASASTPTTNTPTTNTPTTNTPAPADTTPPVLTATQSLTGTTAQTAVTISGTVSDTGSGVARVDVFDLASGSAVRLGAATLSGTSWSFSATGLSDGFHVFDAVATDMAGNASAAVFAAPYVKVDATPATLTASESVSGTGSRTAVALSGTVTDGSGSGVNHIELYDTVGGATVDLGRATINGANWSFTAGSLAPGAHAFSAIVTDNVGNVGSAVSAGAAVTVAAASSASTATSAPTFQSAARASGGVTIRGTAQANASITLTDTVGGGSTTTVGKTTAGSDGSWSITSASIGSAVVNRFAATASLGGGSPVASAGSLILSGTGADTLTGTAGQSDVFAFTGAMGRDTVTNFETFAATGAAHDVMDLSGTAYGSFTQLQSHISSTNAGAVLRFSSTNTITLTGVAANTLTASDFRFT